MVKSSPRLSLGVSQISLTTYRSTRTSSPELRRKNLTYSSKRKMRCSCYWQVRHRMTSCVSAGGKLWKELCQLMTSSIWWLRMMHIIPESANSPLNIHSRPTWACFHRSLPSVIISRLEVKVLAWHPLQGSIWLRCLRLSMLRKSISQKLYTWLRASATAT